MAEMCDYYDDDDDDFHFSEHFFSLRNKSEKLAKK